MTKDITKMMYSELRSEWNRILDEARPRVSPRCKACKECDSTRPKCKFVSSERGKSGIRNYEKIQQIKLACDTIYEGGNGDEIDSSCDFFGHNMRAPIFNAPIAWVKNAFPDSHFKRPGMERVDGRAVDSDDYAYAKSLIDGCADVGAIGWIADSKHHPLVHFYQDGLQAIKEREGLGVPTIKLWDADIMSAKIKQADEAGVIAIATDIDCVGLGDMSINAKYDTLPGIVSPKSARQLKEIFSMTVKPYILKGIMTPQGAVKACESGASGIVISNHAGNSLDQSLATIEVLADIKKAVGNDLKIYIDGGFRHGEDVFKALALGADGVLIGRPIMVAAEGAEAYGVSIYLQKIIWELQNAMRMTGCLTLKDITRDKIYITKEF
ncbi:MAG: alpha-hydroxy-acid oxidizing protein [Lachnospiraceae bacterium]